MYRIIFNYFHLLPGPSENLPGFVYKDQGPATGSFNGLHHNNKFLIV
jgi:hypothetical protein